MAERVRCNACGGVYVPQQEHGTYYHACPPIPNPAFQPDPGAKGYDPRETIPLPGGRNENTEPRAFRRDGEPERRHVPRAIAEGDGVTVLSDDDLPEPGPQLSRRLPPGKRARKALRNIVRKARHK